MKGCVFDDAKGGGDFDRISNEIEPINQQLVSFDSSFYCVRRSNSSKLDYNIDIKLLSNDIKLGLRFIIAEDK